MIQISAMPIHDCFTWDADSQTGKVRSGVIRTFAITLFKKVTFTFSLTVWEYHE